MAAFSLEMNFYGDDRHFEKPAKIEAKDLGTFVSINGTIGDNTSSLYPSRAQAIQIRDTIDKFLSRTTDAPAASQSSCE